MKFNGDTLGLILLVLSSFINRAFSQDVGHKKDDIHASQLFEKLKEAENSKAYESMGAMSFTLAGLNNNSRQAYDMTQAIRTEESRESFIGHWFYDFENKKYRNYSRELYRGGHDLRWEELNLNDTSYYITTQMRKFNSVSKPFENILEDCMYIPGLWLAKLEKENLRLSFIGNTQEGHAILEITFNGTRRRLYLNESNSLEKVSWISGDLMWGKRQNTIAYGYRIDLNGLLVPNKIDQYVDAEKQKIRVPKRIEYNQSLKGAFSLDEDLAPFKNEAWTLNQVSGNVYQYQGLGGNLYNIPFVVFSDFILVYDAILSPGITNKFLESVKADFPGKPVKYVVLSHNHTDHVSGLRGYNSEEITILTSSKTKGRISQYVPEQNRKCKVETIAPGKFKVIASGDVNLKVINVGITPHVDDMLYVRVDSDKAIIEADSYFEFSPWCNIFSFFIDWIESNKLGKYIILGTHLKPTSFHEIQQAREESSEGVYPEYLRERGLPDK